MLHYRTNYVAEYCRRWNALEVGDIKGCGKKRNFALIKVVFKTDVRLEMKESVYLWA